MAEIGEKITGNEKNKKLVAQGVESFTYIVNRTVTEVHSKIRNRFKYFSKKIKDEREASR